jgi:hypothetical protein
MGLILVIAVVPLVIKRFREFSTILKLGVLVLTASFGFAGFIMIVGATRPHRWALYAHIATAVAGSAGGTSDANHDPSPKPQAVTGARHDCATRLSVSIRVECVQQARG